MQLRLVQRWITGLRLVHVCVFAGCAWGGAVAAAPTASAWSADLPAASDGRHLWTWSQSLDPDNADSPRLSLFHADLTHRPPEGPAWEAVVPLTGRLAARGVAADDQALYLIFDDGSTQVVSLRPAPAEGHWYFSKRTAPRLPEGVSVRAAAAAHGKLWALVRIESADTLRQIDQASGPGSDRASGGGDSKDLFDLILGYPDVGALPPEKQPEPTEETQEGEAEPDAPDDSSQSSSTADTALTEAAETMELTEDGDQAVSDIAPDAPVLESGRVASETEPSPEATVEAPAIDLPTERLLVLDRGAWRRVALPQDWPRKLPTQLVAAGLEGERPTLVVQVPSTTGETGVRVFRPTDEDGDSWAAVDLRLLAVGRLARTDSSASSEAKVGYPGGGGVAALRVGGQLLLVKALPSEAGFAAQVSAVRGAKLLPVAAHTPTGDAEEHATTGQWAAVPAGGGVALLAGPRKLGERLDAQVEKFDEAMKSTGPALAVLDLHGQTVLPHTVMHFEPADPIAEAADMVIFMGVLLTSTVLLFTFWRRVPTANQLQLREGTVLADTLRRLLAGLIDLTPGLLVGTLSFGLAWNELYDRWPGRGQGMTFALMVPGLTAIGVIVGHTAILEIATGGRSLGKMLTGLRVTTLEGDTPRAWQSLVRCLLKAFDLIAYLLLILPLISPHRQRLGDMVARTVVTMNAPPPPPENSSGDQGSEGRRS